jgi:hypothetical protein
MAYKFGGFIPGETVGCEPTILPILSDPSPVLASAMDRFFVFLISLLGYPPSPRISGIMELGGKLEIIYGAQAVRGKIFNRKELARFG